MSNTFNLYNIILTFILCFSVSAKSEEACDGEWTVSLSNTSVNSSARERGDLWFPAYIELSKSLSSCVQWIEIEPLGRGGDRIIKGPQSDVVSSLSDDKRIPLAKNGKGQYVLKTLGKRRIRFWLYLANGRQLSPGVYSGELGFSINHYAGRERLRYAQFKYSVKPYVKARINGQGKNGLSFTGSSIRLDMGNLTKRNHRVLDFTVQSNSSVRVWLASENKGNLVNIEIPNRTIPYFITIDGRRRSLNTPVEYRMYNASNLEGTPLKIGVENHPSPYATAGIYQDVMTVSLFAQ